MSGPECDSALAQHLRTRDDVLGLNLFGGGDAVTASSAKITTTLYKINRAKRDMPDPCTQRKAVCKGSARRADAEDVRVIAYGCAYEKELRLRDPRPRLLRCSCAVPWIRCDACHYPAAAAAVFQRFGLYEEITAGS
jgi:hypothetical protein